VISKPDRSPGARAAALETLRDLVREKGEVICSSVSGGATIRYVRVFIATFYRTEDVTEQVIVALDLKHVLVGWLMTAAVLGDDAALERQVIDVVGMAPQHPEPAPEESRRDPPAQGGKKVRVRPPAPTRPPRGGVAVR
jgi:hypothetical protein